MKTSLAEGVMRRNMPKGDVKETSIVCIVANSLSKGYDSSPEEKARSLMKACRVNLRKELRCLLT